MADFRLGRLKFNWRNAWATNTAYVIDDIVKYGANTYVCKTNHTSAANENLFYSSDVNNWNLHTEGIVSKGDYVNSITNGASYWYKLNDVVKYGNTQYRCVTGHTSPIAGFPEGSFVTYVDGLKYENTFAANTVYQIGDIVTYGGYTYVASTNHTATATTPNADSTNWTPLTTGYSNKGNYASGTAYAPGDVVRFGGYAYECILNSTGNKPSDSTYFKVIVDGFKWMGAWAAGTIYQKGDVVNRNSNTYICITNDTTGTANSPENDSNGNYWNYIAQGGSAAQVLQETGDLLYQAAGGINRIALPTGSTGTAAEQAAASGQVLTVGGSPLLPRWEKNNVTDTVYYVAEGGSDTNTGDQISRAFASIRYATDYVSANASPSATNPVTIYVKSGVYEETLPIHVPAYVTVIGDNLRTTVVKAKSGNSNEQTLTLGSNVTSYKLGDIVSNDAGTKTAKVINSTANNNFTILNVTGGLWTTSDKYVDVTDNKHADGSALITANKTFLAYEAWHKYVADNSSNPNGVEATVKSRLEAWVSDLAFNVRAGDNNKVYDYATARAGGSAPITGSDAHDAILLNTIRDVAIKFVKAETVTASAGNNISQTTYSGTADTGAPKCAQVAATITTLTTILQTGITNGNMSHATKTEPYHVISAATNQTNAHSTMWYVASHTIIRDLVMEGMTGFVPDGTDDKDIDASVVKGAYIKLDPASPVQKSPYIQNCSAIGGAAVGAFIDGTAHKHYDGSPTPSFKSACFDAFTQVLEGGVGFYCKGTAALEIVSSFTYYAHISYASTHGGRIRAVSGNSSYGKYGCLSRGFDVNEVTKDGKVEGLRLTTDPAGAKSGTFNTNTERITGGTSGAIGELRSDQSTTANHMYYFPIKGTFQNGELVTGATSSATITLAAANAVTGQKGFTLLAEGLTEAPTPGASIELVDNGSNDDPGSYVISKSSFAAADGRGNLTVTRAQLGSTSAAHDGVSDVAYWDAHASTATLQNSITAGASSPFNLDVNAVTNMVANGFLLLGNELFKITAFVDADTVTVQRAQEGTTAAAHSSGDTITVLGTKSATQDETIEDTTSGQNYVRVKAANVSFGVDDYIKIDNEFMKITAVTPDTTGTVVLSLSDEKAIAAGDGQDFKIRYGYSQVRLTAHDFLDVGTGNRTTTNWPGLPTQENVPSQEIDEKRPGRVYYVSTDQDGNFSVGNFFKVEQSTGKATLNANAFDLTGLDTLRLGAIGAQLGATINEFSTDGTLSQNSDDKVPTQKAIKTYVDASTGAASQLIAGDSGQGTLVVGTQTLTVAGTSNEIETAANNQTITVGLPNNVTIGNNLTVTGDLTVSGSTTTINTTDLEVEDKNIIIGKVASPTDTTANQGGLTLKGATDKTFQWSSSSNSWSSSEALNVASGKSFMINGTNVLTASEVLGKTIGGSGAGDIASIDGTQTLTNKTASALILTSTLQAGGSTGNSGDVLTSTGSGIQWAAPSGGGGPQVFAEGWNAVGSISVSQYFVNWTVTPTIDWDMMLFHYSGTSRAASTSHFYCRFRVDNQSGSYWQHEHGVNYPTGAQSWNQGWSYSAPAMNEGSNKLTGTAGNNVTLLVQNNGGMTQNASNDAGNDHQIAAVFYPTGSGFNT